MTSGGTCTRQTAPSASCGATLCACARAPCPSACCAPAPQSFLPSTLRTLVSALSLSGPNLSMHCATLGAHTACLHWKRMSRQLLVLQAAQSSAASTAC